jgi:hypothetical protein
MNIETTYDMLHWVRIKVYSNHYRQIVEQLYYDRLPFNLRMKYDWYFKYRAALLQVKYPRYHVEFTWGKEAPIHPEDIRRINLRKEISLKAKITKATNVLNRCLADYRTWKENYSELFPMETHPTYKMFIETIKKLNN